MQALTHRMQGILVFKMEVVAAGSGGMYSLAHTDHCGLAW